MAWIKLEDDESGSANWSQAQAIANILQIEVRFWQNGSQNRALPTYRPSSVSIELDTLKAENEELKKEVEKFKTWYNGQYEPWVEQFKSAVSVVSGGLPAGSALGAVLKTAFIKDIPIAPSSAGRRIKLPD